MIIIGYPYLLVTCYEKVRGERVKRNLFRFDQHGEYRTNNPKILKKAARNFVIKEETEIDTSQLDNHTVELMPFEEEIDEPTTNCSELKPKRNRGVPRKKKEIK